MCQNLKLKIAGLNVDNQLIQEMVRSLLDTQQPVNEIFILFMVDCMWFILFFYDFYLVRLGSQGVMYSRHRCFSSMLELPKPCIHSSKNSRVKWGSFAASVSLIDLIKMVLLAGIHRPVMKQKQM